MVIAILQLVFGGIGLLCCDSAGIFQIAMGKNLNSLMGPQQPDQAEMQEKIEKLTAERVPYHKAITVATAIVSPLLSIAMIASGIGLLYMKAWGRILAVFYAVVSILMKIVTGVTTIMVMPATQEVLKEFMAKEPKVAQMAQQIAQMTQFVMYMIVFFMFFTVIYPALVLVFMLLPSTRAAFRGEGTQKSADGIEDYRDEPQA